MAQTGGWVSGYPHNTWLVARAQFFFFSSTEAGYLLLYFASPRDERPGPLGLEPLNMFKIKKRDENISKEIIRPFLVFPISKRRNLLNSSGCQINPALKKFCIIKE